MSIFPGIWLSSLLETFPAAPWPTVLAVTGEGIVLFLQAIAYILVSLAALAVLLRLGLRGGAHGCGCHGKGRCKTATTASGSATSSADSPHGAPVADADTPHSEAGNRLVGRTNNYCEPAANFNANTQARFAAPEPMSERDRLSPAGAPHSGGSIVASIRAASNLPPAVLSDESAESPAADKAAAEQRRLTAVIAAAVHNALGGQPHRIVRIEPVNYGWAQEGRRDIFSSRRVR